MSAVNARYGTSIDGSQSEDFCSYCFENGIFTSDHSMEAMIEICVPHVVSATPGMSEDDARNMMRKFFPTLKRWARN